MGGKRGTGGRYDRDCGAAEVAEDYDLVLISSANPGHAFHEGRRKCKTHAKNRGGAPSG
jgi:hypothetical protein